MSDAETKLALVRKLLEQAGCDCECGKHWYYDDHDDDCERCLACRIAAVVQ